MKQLAREEAAAEGKSAEDAPQVMDKGDLFQKAGATSGPKFILLDQDRKILKQETNPERLEDFMAEILNRRR